MSSAGGSRGKESRKSPVRRSGIATVVGSALGGLGRGGRGGGGECGVVLFSGVSGRLVWRGKGGFRCPPYRGFLRSRRRRLRRDLWEGGAEDVGLECEGEVMEEMKCCCHFFLMN